MFLKPSKEELMAIESLKGSNYDKVVFWLNDLLSREEVNLIDENDPNRILQRQGGVRAVQFIYNVFVNSGKMLEVFK